MILYGLQTAWNKSFVQTYLKVTLGDFLLNRHDANSMYPELRMKSNAHVTNVQLRKCAEFRLSTNCAERACVF